MISDAETAVITQNANSLCRNVLRLNSTQNRSAKIRARGISSEEAEKLAIITNSKSETLDNELPKILESAAKSTGAKVEVIHFAEGNEEEGLKKFIEGSFDVAIRLAFDSVQLTNKLEEIAQNKQMRMIEMPQADRYFFLSEVFSELQGDIQKREQSLMEILPLTDQVFLTANDGTDLSFKTDIWASESIDYGTFGIVAVDNFPIGEICTNILLGTGNGKLVLHYLDSYVDGTEGVFVDEPVILTFENGEAIDIKGGESARKLKDYLKKTSVKDNDSRAAYRLCEMAFPTSKKARFYKVGEKVTTLEAEKTCVHVAIGDHPIREVEPSKLNTSEVHLDFLLPGVKAKVKGETMEAIFNDKAELQWISRK